MNFKLGKPPMNLTSVSMAAPMARVRFQASASVPREQAAPVQPNTFGRYDAENRPLFDGWVKGLASKVKFLKLMRETVWHDSTLPSGDLKKRVLANLMIPNQTTNVVMVQVDTRKDGSKKVIITNPEMFTRHTYLNDEYRQHICLEIPKWGRPKALVFRQAWSGRGYGEKKESIFTDKASLKQVAKLAQQLEDLIEPPTGWQRFKRLIGL
jgi:hypothetical protein